MDPIKDEMLKDTIAKAVYKAWDFGTPMVVYTDSEFGVFRYEAFGFSDLGSQKINAVVLSDGSYQLLGEKEVCKLSTDVFEDF